MRYIGISVSGGRRKINSPTQANRGLVWATRRLTELGSQGPQGAVASYAYTLGQAGNRTGVTELSGRTVAYTYDTLVSRGETTSSPSPATLTGS